MMAVGIEASGPGGRPARVRGEAAKTRPPLVLVADDDVALQVLARSALQQDGFAVVEAIDGAAALESFSRCHPDLVLLDINMPKADGFTVCSRIRQLPEGTNTPVMIMTALDDVEAIHTAYEVGATDFVTKPLQWVLLGYRIRYVLRGKTLEARLAQAQRLEAIGRLAAGVAHEINTPIQFVGDNTRFLQTAFDDLHRSVRSCQALRDAVKAGTVGPAVLTELERVERETDVDYLVGEIPRAVSQTLDGVTRVATLVRSLKEFAHPDGKEKVPTDLNRALLSTLTVARHEIKYVADVETDFGELPLVMCQPGELNQVFLNVIVNAAHAIADAVGDSGRKGVIRVRTEREDDMALVAISDTGCGIPEAHRAKIFDPFFTTKEVGRGTGQGLAIAHAVVVDKHGGALTFETEVGRGTTFFIGLPIARAESKGDV